MQLPLTGCVPDDSSASARTCEEALTGAIETISPLRRPTTASSTLGECEVLGDGAAAVVRAT
jgi:hypothetical protein